MPYTLVSLGLDFTQMVLDVRENLKPTQFYMLNNLCFNNFPKKSDSWGCPGPRSSRNLSAPPTLIRAGNLKFITHFRTLRVKPDPTVPHTCL